MIESEKDWNEIGKIKEYEERKYANLDLGCVPKNRRKSNTPSPNEKIKRKDKRKAVKKARQKRSK